MEARITFAWCAHSNITMHCMHIIKLYIYIYKLFMNFNNKNTFEFCGGVNYIVLQLYIIIIYNYTAKKNVP